jgi:hypothetical protein
MHNQSAPALAMIIRGNFNAKTQRRKGTAIFKIPVVILGSTIGLLPPLAASMAICFALFASLRLCVFALNSGLTFPALDQL